MVTSCRSWQTFRTHAVSVPIAPVCRTPASAEQTRERRRCPSPGVAEPLRWPRRPGDMSGPRPRVGHGLVALFEGDAALDGDRDRAGLPTGDRRVPARRPEAPARAEPGQAVARRVARWRRACRPAAYRTGAYPPAGPRPGG